MTDAILVEQQVAVYLTQAPGSRIYVAGKLRENDQNVHGNFIGFAPTGEVMPHPHALQSTYQVQGFAFASNPALIEELDRLQRMGHVPFVRHPNPEICLTDGNEPGIGAGAGAGVGG